MDDEDSDDDRPQSRRSGRGGRRSMNGRVVTLRRVGVLTVGKVMGVMYTILGVIIAIPYALIILLAAGGASTARDGGGAAGTLGAMGVCLAVFIPVFYGIAGFIGGIIAAALYNLVASWTGGIEMELD